MPTSDAEPRAGIDPTGTDAVAAADAAAHPEPAVAAVPSEPAVAAVPVSYDFAGAARPTRQRARLIRVALDELARLATDALRLWIDDLRVEVADVEVRTLAELFAGEVDHVAVALAQCGESGLVVSELAFARSLVLTLLGGAGGAGGDDGPTRPLTAIDTEVLDLVLARLLHCTAQVLGLGPAELGIHGADPSTTTPFDEAEPALAIPFQLHTAHRSGRMWLVLSPSALEPFVTECERRQAARPVAGRPSDRQRTEALLGGVPVPVSCGFPIVRVPARELAFLAVGDVVRTGHPTNRHLVVSVGGTPLFAARAGQRGLRLVAEVVEALPANRAPLHPSTLLGGTS